MNPIRALQQTVARMSGGKPGQKRRHDRHTCMIVAKLSFPDKAIEIDGIVNEISISGARFRTATTYILDRTGERCSVSMEGLVIAGVIRNVSPDGYGIALDQWLDEDDVEHLIKQFSKAA